MNKDTKRRLAVETAIENAKKPGRYKESSDKIPRWKEYVPDDKDRDKEELKSITPSNEELKKIALRNPPPQEWFDGEEEDLFQNETE